MPANVADRRNRLQNPSPPSSAAPNHHIGENPTKREGNLQRLRQPTTRPPRTTCMTYFRYIPTTQLAPTGGPICRRGTYYCRLAAAGAAPPAPSAGSPSAACGSGVGAGGGRTDGGGAAAADELLLVVPSLAAVVTVARGASNAAVAASATAAAAAAGAAVPAPASMSGAGGRS